MGKTHRSRWVFSNVCAHGDTEPAHQQLLPPPPPPPARAPLVPYHRLCCCSRPSPRGTHRAHPSFQSASSIRTANALGPMAITGHLNSWNWVACGMWLLGWVTSTPQPWFLRTLGWAGLRTGHTPLGRELNQEQSCCLLVKPYLRFTCSARTPCPGCPLPACVLLGRPLHQHSLRASWGLLQGRGPQNPLFASSWVLE